MSGAQRRFQQEYVETVDKIKSGAIGDVRALYAYWVGTPVIQQKARDPKWGDMTWQHRNWYSFVWLCGDQIVEQHLHNIDVCNWVMGGPPAKVVATGGAVWRPKEELYGNIYDHISADFEYPNGSAPIELLPAVSARPVFECERDGGGGEGQVELPGPGDAFDVNPYVAEHIALVKSIRGDGPYINHAMTVAESTLTCIMARGVRLFGAGDHVGYDHELAAGPAAEDVRL